jgi:hypothetical protein
MQMVTRLFWRVPACMLVDNCELWTTYRNFKMASPHCFCSAIARRLLRMAGTVYSVQGFEFRHVGVLMGPDLVVRDGRWAANPKYNFRNSIRGKTADVASIYLQRIYRTLFTRLPRSIRVCSVDEETSFFARGHTQRLLDSPQDVPHRTHL